MSQDERRRHPRFKVRVAVELALGAERFEGRLKDVCRDAALVEVGRSLSLGDEVALALALPGTAGPLRAVGQVVRIAPGEADGRQDAAILFADLTPTAETRIEFFLAQQAHEHSGE